MPIYVTLFRFTRKEFSTSRTRSNGRRLSRVEQEARRDVKEALDLGAHDGVLVFEAPDDETLDCYVGRESAGQCSHETMRGFTAAEMEKLVAKVD